MNLWARRLVFVLALPLALNPVVLAVEKSAPARTLVATEGKGYLEIIDGYRVHLHWHGEDRDGDIAYFLWAWTDSSDAYYSAWNPESDPEDRILRGGDFDATHLTTRTDSVFVLLANDNGSMSRDLSFNITAVDDQGKRDPVPARLYFTASVDRRPNVLWLDEPWGALDPDAKWIATEPETLDAGQPFSCAFTGETDNGFIKGFQAGSIDNSKRVVCS